MSRTLFRPSTAASNPTSIQTVTRPATPTKISDVTVPESGYSVWAGTASHSIVWENFILAETVDEITTSALALSNAEKILIIAGKEEISPKLIHDWNWEEVFLIKEKGKFDVILPGKNMMWKNCTGYSTASTYGGGSSSTYGYGRISNTLDVGSVRRKITAGEELTDILIEMYGSKKMGGNDLERLFETLTEKVNEDLVPKTFKERFDLVEWLRSDSLFVNKTLLEKITKNATGEMPDPYYIMKKILDKPTENEFTNICEWAAGTSMTKDQLLYCIRSVVFDNDIAKDRECGIFKEGRFNKTIESGQSKKFLEAIKQIIITDHPTEIDAAELHNLLVDDPDISVRL